MRIKTYRCMPTSKPGDFIMFDEGVEALLAGKRVPRVLRALNRMQLVAGLLVGSIQDRDGILIPNLTGAADFIGFNEGQQVAVASGWPATCKFDLSTNAVSDFTAATAYASRAAITGTTYAQGSQSRPSATGLGSLAFTQMSWATGANTDWTSPKTIVCNDGSSKIYCAWNLVAGGAARDMSQANTTLQVTPTYAPTNP